VIAPPLDMIEGLLDSLVGPLTGQARPDGKHGSFNQDAAELIRMLMQIRRKYPNERSPQTGEWAVPGPGSRRRW
jgi:hypothetical protein